MAQDITPALAALLVSKLQVGEAKHRGEIEIDYVIPGFTEIGELQDLNLAYGTVSRDASRHTGDVNRYWHTPTLANDGSDSTEAYVNGGVTNYVDYLMSDLGAAFEVASFNLCGGASGELDQMEYSTDGSTWNVIAFTETGSRSVPAGATLTFDGGPITARYWAMRAMRHGGSTGVQLKRWEIRGTPVTEHAPTIGTATFQVASMALDRSRRMAAGQLDALLANEDGTKGYYSGDGRTFVPNNPVRAYAWLGDRDNRVRVFTGLLDLLAEHRNPKTVALKARSRAKWLIEQSFAASAPQGADEEGAVRTEANGVYLGKTIEYIVGDILDRAGVPTADRDIATTGITLAEYVLADGGSWADQITGADRLATAAGCDLVEDELGVFHFQPSPLVAAVEPDPAWDFAAGLNVLALDHQVDDEDRATRVEVGGPMTSSVPRWAKDWSTSKLNHPTGVWYDETDPDYIRVVDRLTKYIYRMKQSDRSIASKAYLGGHPMGLAGDPTDDTHYYVLHAPWMNTGATTGNTVREYDANTNALLATHSLPNGRWSDLKTDGTNLWLTNYDDGKLYKRTMTGGAVSDHAITHDGELQDAATGLWLLGTEIGVFFAAHKRFLVVDTSAPGTVTGVQSTKGTRIAGGERATDDSTILFAVASAGSFGLASGMVAKFTLAELVTNDVSALAVDWDLEDALGFQSGIADRDHEDCPNDGDPHPYEARLASYAMKVVQSLDQAQDVADAQLALLSRLRRVLDLATLGHPGIQVNDPVSYADPIAGIDSVWVIDTYRAQLSGAGTYTQTMSLLPWEAP